MGDTMRALLSMHWLLTTLGMFKVHHAIGAEVAKQQDSAPGHGLAVESDPLEPVLQGKPIEPHQTKAAKTEE